ncbi:MAG: non-hydrolyzing UDP-N-acetylglucosamine 2-epimerase [Flavisolibacter sp.]
MKKIISIVGARPNFMKIAPLHRAFQPYRHLVKHLICHTGQHYDEKMSKVFFDELGLPQPDFYLGIGGGSHAVQTAGIMVAFEAVLLEEKPDLIIVVGDVNSTIACSLVAKKLQVKVAHVEAGLRSRDMTMPEEINRILTDAISDYLFVTEKSGMDNLIREGVDQRKIFFTGNVMIDSLVQNETRIDASPILGQWGLQEGHYILATFHRPSNVDDMASLEKILLLLNQYAQVRKIIFPIHPRTRANIEKFGLKDLVSTNLLLCDPIGYIDFISLIKNAELILTDSGGIQEESTYLKVPCLTLRNNTERPVTVEIGTNQLVGVNLEKLDRAIRDILGGKRKQGRIPEGWDGKASERICSILVGELCEKNPL